MRARAWAVFRSFVDRRPLTYNMLTVTGLFTVGDITQHLVANTPQDWTNTGNIAAVSFAWFGPTFYYFYKWLDFALPGNRGRVVLKKLAVDQLVIGSSTLAGFYVALSALEGRSDWFRELREKFKPSYISSCLFWTPVQLVNFALIPSTFRVTYICFTAFGWTNILCYIKSKKPEETQEFYQDVE